MLDEPSDELSSLLDRLRDVGTQTILLKDPARTFDLGIALRTIGAGFHVGHATEPNELLEVLRDELQAVLGDDSRAAHGELFPCSLQDHFHIGLFHTRAPSPVNEEPAAAIQHADRGCQWLLKALACPSSARSNQPALIQAACSTSGII